MHRITKHLELLRWNSNGVCAVRFFFSALIILQISLKAASFDIKITFQPNLLSCAVDSTHRSISIRFCVLLSSILLLLQINEEFARKVYFMFEVRFSDGFHQTFSSKRLLWHSISAWDQCTSGESYTFIQWKETCLKIEHIRIWPRSVCRRQRHICFFFLQKNVEKLFEVQILFHSAIFFIDLNYSIDLSNSFQKFAAFDVRH